MKIHWLRRPMTLPMALRAQANKVVLGVVEFVTVNMMNVKIVPPSLPSFSAILASPLVAVSDAACYGFPVVGVRPFSHAAAPSWIAFTPDCPADCKGLGLTAPRDAKLVHEFGDGAAADIERGSYVSHRSLFDIVGIAKPCLILVREVFSVMTRSVDIPVVLSLIPSNKLAAPALAIWRAACREIHNWLAALSVRVGLLGVPHLHPVTHKHVSYRLSTNAVHASNDVAASPRAIAGGTCVDGDNPLLVFFGEFSLAHKLASANIIPHGALV